MKYPALPLKHIHAFVLSISISILGFPASTFAVDETEVSAKGTKDRIQALEAEIEALNNRIDNIQLTPGPQGEAGPQGPAGNDGAVGATGAQGPTGAQGADGTDGEDGADSAGPVVEFRPPTNYDDFNAGYAVGTRWVDTVGGEVYVLVDDSMGAAVWEQITPKTYAIGDTGPAGGIVFHVTDGGVHGLERAREMSAVYPLLEWGCEGVDVYDLANIVDRDVPDPNSGAFNTPLIVAQCGTESAAGYAAGFIWPDGQTGGYLPNKDELHRLCVLGFLPIGTWWSSTEFSSTRAWGQSTNSTACELALSNGDKELARTLSVRTF